MADAPRILVLAGSIRTGSFNALLANNAADSLGRAGAAVTRLSLKDYPLPLYDGDLEARDGVPAEAVALKERFTAHQGVLLVCPEYNAGVTPLLKNALDWVSRVRGDGEPPLPAYKNRVFALASASPGGYGGMRGLIAMRQILALGTGALVLSEQVVVARAASAFDEAGALKDEGTRRMLDQLAIRLVDAAARLAA